MLMERVLEPEWLDELPAHDTRAKGSRADLRRINRCMGHARFIARELRFLRKPRRVCDLGAGDGTLLLQVVRALDWHDLEIVLVDRQPVVSQVTRAMLRARNCAVTILESDVCAALKDLPPGEVIITNLFLHHFDKEQLGKMFASIAERTTCFVACEPRRSAFALLASRCLGLIGCNAVTRHDGVISVRAGFRGAELTRLWPGSAGWLLRERAAGMFSHCFTARKE